MTKLALKGVIATRWHVKKLAEGLTDVTEVDFSQVDIIGGSTMHQFLLSFPNAAFTGLEGWNKQEYEWVIEAINSDEWKKNTGGE